MFDLEKSIADWRRQMLAAGINTPVPLEELEIHLREDIERQMASGRNSRQAFENSVQRIGHADELKGEFKKIGGTTCVLPQWSLFWTGVVGLVLTLIMSGIVTPPWNWVMSFVVPRSALESFVHRSWNVWLPNYVTFTTFIISGLVIGVARWETKWTLLRISSTGFIGTMMVNGVCRFVFHGSDGVSLFLQRVDLPWWGFYANWMIFIVMGLLLGLSNYTLWLTKLVMKLQRKTTSD
jgi:hypothetical protein